MAPEPRRINWRQEYLHLAVVLMMCGWLTPWIALSLNWFLKMSFPAALVFTAVHLLASLLLVRGLRYRRLDTAIPWAIFLLFWLAVGLSLAAAPSFAGAYQTGAPLHFNDLFHFSKHTRLPGGPAIIFWVGVLWWRGYQIGLIGSLSIVRASFGMRLGILAFLWIFVVGPAQRAGALALVPFFFFFGLLSSGLARADSLSLDQAGRKTAFGRGWMLSLLAITLLLTGLGYLAALWMAGMDLARAAGTLGTLGEGALHVIGVIASPVLFVADMLYKVADWIIPDQVSQSVTRTSRRVQSGEGISAPWLYQLLEFLWHALTILVIVLFALLVLALVWFLLLRFWLGRRDEGDEERETLGTGEVVGGLRNTLREGWRRLADALGIFRQFGLGRDLFAALTIRRIYARMEKLAARRGYPRAPSETPYEYRRELGQAFPGMERDIQCITEAYITVRYGEVPETNAEIQAVRAAWDRLNASSDGMAREL